MSRDARKLKKAPTAGVCKLMTPDTDEKINAYDVVYLQVWFPKFELARDPSSQQAGRDTTLPAVARDMKRLPIIGDAHRSRSRLPGRGSRVTPAPAESQPCLGPAQHDAALTRAAQSVSGRLASRDPNTP